MSFRNVRRGADATIIDDSTARASAVIPETQAPAKPPVAASSLHSRPSREPVRGCDQQAPRGQEGIRADLDDGG
jgi:hypothetical protein